MHDYRQNYLAMNNDELLNLAAQQNSLLPEAQAALTAVLSERRLTGNDVQEQSRWRAETVIEQRRSEPLRFSLNGFGTGIYGRRDFEADGSFVTTKWITLLWIPVFPLTSFRIVPIKAPGAFSFLSRGEYRIIDEFSPNLRQVALTYLYAIVLIFAVLRLFSARASETVSLAVIGLWACVPWLLRGITRQ